LLLDNLLPFSLLEDDEDDQADEPESLELQAEGEFSFGVSKFLLLLYYY